MFYEFFSIPARQSRQADEPQQQLNRFLAAHAVISVDREFVNHAENSYWSFCVGVEQLKADKPRAARTGSVDYKELLSAEHFSVYAHLRSLRNQMAEQQGMPAYAIFSNEQLAQMAQLSPAEQSRVCGNRRHWPETARAIWRYLSGSIGSRPCRVEQL